MGKKNKIVIEPRQGKPSVCIVCGEKLHNKSEYYCSEKCSEDYKPNEFSEKPEFISKWKIRKRKVMRDPFLMQRNKIRNKTKKLIKTEKIKKKPCQIWNSKNSIAHHEDYTNPYKIIWLCEKHHKEYHEGKIAINKGSKKWNPKKLHNFIKIENNKYLKNKYKK